MEYHKHFKLNSMFTYITFTLLIASTITAGKSFKQNQNSFSIQFYKCEKSSSYEIMIIKCKRNSIDQPVKKRMCGEKRITDQSGNI